MKRRTFLRTTAVGALAFPFVPSLALGQGALVVDGVAFPHQVDAGGTRLRLHRAVLFRYRRIIRAYRAALYLGEGVSPTQVLADVPKRLELSYCLGIDGADFGPAAEQIMERMLSPEQMAALRPRLERLHSSYLTVREDDRYALTNVPGRGLELALNGRPIITIPGSDFQRAYFAIWFGRAPLSAHLRDELLGRNA